MGIMLRDMGRKIRGKGAFTYPAVVVVAEESTASWQQENHEDHANPEQGAEGEVRDDGMLRDVRCGEA